ncbi:hypothetical protein [Chitinophaga sp. LS1]|uniref:hypothetical protein n=1 Tax=Chitinophaga sp. LS1 TaxID=3051176 RepID=UPI002AAB1383|nr:hypothetical protein [Chitinophaga sp. LS1]WPV66117.1 hypothetical protein QQL36_30420 [Chitinophaga sp. LS1]
MKHYLSVLLLVCCALFSCKKDNPATQPPTPENKARYPVSFNVSDFTQTVSDLKKSGDINAKDDSLVYKLNYLYIIVYDSAGNWLKEIIQQAWVTPNFGVYGDTLAAGNYKIMVAGSKSYLQVNGLDINPADPPGQYSFSQTFVSFLKNAAVADISVDDFFCKTATFSVTSSTNHFDINLERKVGMLEVNVLDAPDDPYFDIATSIEGYKYFPAVDTSLYLRRSSVIPPVFTKLAYSQKLSTTKWLMYVLNTTEPFDVVINSNYGDNESVTTNSQYKVIHNVRCYRNKKTILTGYLYGRKDSVDVDITISDQWDSTNVEIPF